MFKSIKKFLFKSILPDVIDETNISAKTVHKSNHITLLEVKVEVYGFTIIDKAIKVD